MIFLEAAFGLNRAFQLYLCSGNVFVLSVFTQDPLLLLAHLGIAVVGDLPYVVNHAVEQPLDIYFDLAPQSKAIEAFVRSDVGKDRLGYGYSSRVDPASLLRINLAGHPPGKIAKLNGNGNP